MSVYLNDTFTEAVNPTALSSHTSENGATYLQVGTSAAGVPDIFNSIGGAVGIGTPAGPSLWRASSVAPKADQTIFASMLYFDTSYHFAGIGARVAADGSQGYFMLYNKDTLSFELYRYINLAFSGAPLASYSFALTLSASTDIALKVVGTGTTVTVQMLVAGAVVATFADTDAARVVLPGYPAMYWNGTNPGQGLFFDSLSAQDVAPAAASAIVVTGAASGTTGTTTSLRVSTDNALAGLQSEVVTFADGAGGSFNPTSVTLDATTGFAFVTYTPTVTLGARTVSATGTPMLTAASYSYTVTAQVPASALTLTGPSSVVVGSQANITVGANQPLTGSQSLTITLADSDSGSFGAQNIVLNASMQSVQLIYTPSSIGSHTLTASATGTPTVTNATLTFPVTIVQPIFLNNTLNVYEVGTNRQFTTTDAVCNFINNRDLVTSNANVLVNVFNSLPLTIGYSLNTDETHRVTWQPAPGTGYADLEAANSARAYPTVGIELTIANNVFFRGATTMRGIRINSTTENANGAIYFGGLGSGRGIGRMDKCFVIHAALTGPAIGAQYELDITNSIFIRTSGTGTLVSAFQVGSSGCTFQAKSPGVVTLAFVTGQVPNTDIRNNVFLNCGSSPVSVSQGFAGYVNNYTNVVTTTADPSMIVDTVNSFVQNLVSDLRPASPGAIIGKGDFKAASVNDNYGNNRGLTPDAGALQLVPAMPLPVLVITSQVLDGQNITYSGTTTNTPTSGTITISPAVTPNSATALGPKAVTIGTNTFTVSFSDISPGNYDVPVITGTNAGGTYGGSGGNGFTVIGITGNPEAANARLSIIGAMLLPSA